MDLVVGVIKQSGLLANDCSKWHKKDKADKTWDNLKAHFKRAAKDLKYQQSAGSSGFANAAQQELANMAADTIDSQATALVNANTLVEHSNTLCANYAKRVKQLEVQVTGGGGGNQLPGVKYVQLLKLISQCLHYCHACGICPHSRDRCIPAKHKTGHKEAATATNRLNGLVAITAELAALGLKLKLQGGTGNNNDNNDNLIPLIEPSPSSPPISNPPTIPTKTSNAATSLIADTGTTGNFSAVSSNICINVRPVTKGVSVLLPDTSYMHSTHVGELPLPNLPAAARTVHLFPKMGRALLEIPLLFDHGCQAIFDADWLLVKNKSTGRTFLTGLRDKETRLWLVDLANHIKL